MTGYDPIFVDNQGLYFDGTSNVRTTGTWTQEEVRSITVEGWIRPFESTLIGRLFSFESAPNTDEFSINLKENTYEVKFGTTSVSVPFSSYSAADVNVWQYFGVSVQRIGDTESEVCAVFGTGAEA